MRIGIDIGSVSVKSVVLDGKRVVEAHYARHKGEPLSLLFCQIEEILKHHNITFCGVTGRGGRCVAEYLGVPFLNEVVALAKGVRELSPETRTVIEIGGEDSKLVKLRDRRLSDFSMNTICAAGAGSFLDQQASRMGLTIEEFSELSVKPEHPPRIAGRCSVFAKTDMIHLQQEATPVEEIIAGLCFAFARNFKSVIGRGKEIEPPILFCGGVAKNGGMLRAFRETLKTDIGVSEHSAVMCAVGAGLMSTEIEDIESIFDIKVEKRGAVYLEPLREPEKSGKTKIHPVKCKKVWLGIDIGSVSTNVVAIDEEKKIIARRYLPTASRPIDAVCKGLSELHKELGDVEVVGCGTTGSGRYMIGNLVGADIIKNEITAQARAAIEQDPAVDTIFEIGGQDSKFISLENGAITDFEMNKVCAAGTGSFLEEQAERLGISIKDEFSESAFSSEKPISLGERCTVFMEQDILSHQQQGAEKCDLVAGLSYSIVQNYLNRVVGEKRIGNRIFFQGGVAKNEAVVAAFEKVLDRKITVPENCDVTGAIGAALIAKEKRKGKSRFRGFDLAKRGYELSSFECKHCSNHCEIKRVILEGKEPLFYGARCERYEKKRERKEKDLPDLFGFREELLCNIYDREIDSDRKIGIPRILFFYEFFPFYKALLSELGFSVVFSEKTNKSLIHKGLENTPVDTCFPIKLSFGHIMSLAEEDIEFLFLPSVINLKKEAEVFSDSYHCPYVQSIPYQIRSALRIEKRVLSPIIRAKYGKREIEKAFFEVADDLGVLHSEIRKAVSVAEDVQEEFKMRIREKGKEVLESLPEKAIVIISRSYNGQDEALNLGLPKKLRDLGVLSIPLDFLSLDSVNVTSEWPNMYWRSGQQILSAAEIVRENSNLFAVYLTNYGCGPDSFISTFFKKKMGEKPHLIIEVDEHSADVGAITRCEAFLDSIKNRRFGPPKRIKRVLLRRGERRRIYIPYMSDHAYALCAAFSACGVDAEVMAKSDEETSYWGRRYTLGRECYPAIVTIGDMVRETKRSDFDPKTSAFFMGGSSGPCRFGQYSMLQRLVLDDLGLSDVPIYAPNQAKDFFKDLELIGKDFERLAWRGIVACDILEKALREKRPYERNRGETEEVYKEYLEKVCCAIRERRDLLPVMREAGAAFSAILVNKERRPVIGLLGEFFVRSNAFSNEDIVKRLEDLGAEVWAAPVNEWFLYRNFRRCMHARLDRDFRTWLKTKIKNWLQVRDEHRLSEPFYNVLRGAKEPSTKDILSWAEPYIHYSFEGEAIMSIGKSFDFAEKRVSGIVNTIPFTCMPGTIAQCILQKVSEDLGGIPCITISYDGLGQANTEIRLEAFVHQAKEFLR